MSKPLCELASARNQFRKAAAARLKAFAEGKSLRPVPYATSDMQWARYRAAKVAGKI